MSGHSILTLHRGVEMQIRPHGQEASYTYPLTLDEKLKQGDAYRRAKDNLLTRLRTIDETFPTSQTSHTGEVDCESCIFKKRQIKDAFAEYYLSNDPGHWDAGNTRYREEIENLNTYNRLELVHFDEVHEAHLRGHLQLDFCTPRDTDNTDILSSKTRIAHMFQDGAPLNDIIDVYARDQLKLCPTPDARDFQFHMQNLKTPEERAQLYAKYYCTIEPQDSTAVKTMKGKYARQFSELIPHDIVLASMRKEANKLHEAEISKLRAKANEMQMAKSASMKEKRRRAELADQRMLAKNEERSRYAMCELHSCTNELDLHEDTMECVLCDWLASKDPTRSRAYYCSLAHADEDFVSSCVLVHVLAIINVVQNDHDKLLHKCCMGTHCHFTLYVGSAGEADGGVCSDCMNHGITSYFCSNQCFELNLVSL